MVVYGEHMINKHRFRYDEDDMHAKCPVFGAVICPSTNDAVSIIAEKLAAAKFACSVRLRYEKKKYFGITTSVPTANTESDD